MEWQSQSQWNPSSVTEWQKSISPIAGLVASSSSWKIDLLAQASSGSDKLVFFVLWLSQ